MGSSGDRGPCRLHAHSTAHCGAASLAFIGPNHACRSHCELLSPNNNTPVKTGVLGVLYRVGDGPDGYGQVVFHSEITSSRSFTLYGSSHPAITARRSDTSTTPLPSKSPGQGGAHSVQSSLMQLSLPS
mgnify:CR=1 FL=1